MSAPFRDSFRALTLDLDDTLWPIGPTIARAETALQSWLADRVPGFAARWRPADLLALRQRVAAEQPGLAHDLSQLRLATLRQALQQSGEDPALAEPAFEVFFAHRQQVEFYDDAWPALQRLAARFPLVAVTNGNTDLTRVGLDGCFVGCISAADAGVAKPHPGIYQAAARRLGAAPHELLHVGDDWELDVQASLRAGWQAAAWVRRGPAALHGPAAVPQSVWPVNDLLELCARLGA